MRRLNFLRQSGMVLLALLATAVPVFAQSINPADLPGIVVDDVNVEFAGEWKSSTHVSPYIGPGYRHDDNAGKGEKSARFSAQLEEDGEYHVLLSYTSGGTRATNVPVTIHTADGEEHAVWNQRIPAPFPGGFAHLGKFRFIKDNEVVVIVSTAGTTAHVVVDSLQLLTPDEFKQIKTEAKKNPQQVVKKPKATPLPATSQEAMGPPLSVATTFSPVAPADKFKSLQAAQLDALLATEVAAIREVPQVNDEVFLRRLSLDLVGRQPTVDELEAFAAETSPDKHRAVIDRLLASPEYGENWANYWSDVIGSRQTEPELTFHDYKPFKTWLAEKLNAGRRWDDIAFQMLTATGKVADNPAGTFVAFHQANANLLAGETSRVMLGVQIACAECHDHPFVDMPQSTFHGMAAFFARVEAKIPWNDSGAIELKSKEKGEHKMPGQKEDMKPVALGYLVKNSPEHQLGLADLERRAALASWVIHPENPFFARAYVNRIWARLIGRGFYEPVDELGEMADDPVLTNLHEALAGHFIATGYDHKELVRVIVSSRAYQRDVLAPEAMTEALKDQPISGAVTKKLRGDEVFDSLAVAIGLPNYTPPKEKPKACIRFPVPPKSTRDLVNEAFGYDPSFKDDLLVRTMKQAMFLMNNEQLQKQIDAKPESETYLAKLLTAETDDQLVATKLYRGLLARSPSEQELAIVMKHVAKVGDRGPAFEDILWSLINSAEFTTRR